MADSDNQAEDMARETHVMEQFDRWTDSFATFIAKREKCRPDVGVPSTIARLAISARRETPAARL